MSDLPSEQRSGVVYFCADCGAKLDGLGIGHGADCLVPLIERLRAENETLRKGVQVWLRSPQTKANRLAGIRHVLDDPEYAARMAVAFDEQEATLASEAASGEDQPPRG